MMQVNALIPPPPKHLEQWPWLVRIYCFNQVQIELNGQRLKQEGKSQKKVIELLLTIIALGGQDVSGEKVCDVLWPDSDGDMAKQALKTAIFRLRNLIGKSTVLVSDGKISLNDKHCWIDLWAFETTFQELDDELRQNNNDALVIELSNRLLHLYQGSFLKQMDSGVIKFKQEQLQNKILRMLNRLRYYHEKRQEHGRICWLL
ncbi:AfsR/SARP family transcriptional regulator, partial [Bathymodiolus platifrons methanotrophic gill symbiont]|uniref:AfsR/SARP family transcriptional regulator n=1 Tax=Bathymodiolus platifrons methanotrophic gill symbiont TaxID=113268 RepID=UPI00403999F9